MQKLYCFYLNLSNYLNIYNIDNPHKYSSFCLKILEKCDKILILIIFLN